MKPVFDGDWLEDGQLVVSIANSDVTNKRSEVDRSTYERARPRHRQRLGERHR